MATVDIDLLIKTANSASSLKEVRDSMKQLKSEMLSVEEGSDEFNRMAASVANLKDRMDDVNDRIKQLHPDGFAAITDFAGKAAGAVSAVTGAMALFGDESEDVQKALMKVQAAMAFAQGLQSLKDMGKAFQGLWAVISANPLGALVAALAAVAAIAYKAYNAFNENSEAVKRANAEYEKQKELTAELVHKKQMEIDLLVAQGASEDEIIAAKKELIAVQIAEAKSSIELSDAKLKQIEQNDSLWESIVKLTGEYANMMGMEKTVNNASVVYSANKNERTKEEADLKKQKLMELEQLENQLLVFDAERETKKRNNSKATLDERVKNEQDYTDALLKEIEERRLSEESAADAREQLEFERWQAAKLRREEDAKNHRDYVDAKHAKEQEEHEKRKKQIQEQQKLEEMVMKARLDAVAGLFGSLAQLAGKNQKLVKAFSVAEATINTYKGVTAALADPLLPFPIKLINAATVLATGLANVRKILAVEPNSAGGGATSGGGGIASGASGAAALGSAPAQPTAPTTQLDENGNVVGQSNQQQQNQLRVYVVESDIRSTGNRVQVAEAAATFR